MVCQKKHLSEASETCPECDFKRESEGLDLDVFETCAHEALTVTRPAQVDFVMTRQPDGTFRRLAKVRSYGARVLVWCPACGYEEMFTAAPWGVGRSGRLDMPIASDALRRAMGPLVGKTITKSLINDIAKACNKALKSVDLSQMADAELALLNLYAEGVDDLNRMSCGKFTAEEREKIWECCRHSFDRKKDAYDAVSALAGVEELKATRRG